MPNLSQVDNDNASLFPTQTRPLISGCEMDRLKYQIRVVRFLCLYALFRMRIFKFSDLAYSDAHENDALDILTRHDSQKSAISKVIWMFWDSPNPPEHIMAFHKKMKAINQQHEIILLDRNSLHKYLPALHFDYQGIGWRIKATSFGWRDYSAMVVSSTLVYQDFSWVHQRSGYDVVSYYSDGTTVDKDFPVVEAWFLASPPGNAFIARWLELIMPLTHISIDDYYAQITQRSDFADIRQGINRGSYIIINFLCQIVMREQPGFSCYLKKCESSAFFYQDAFRWDSLKMSLFLLCSREPATHTKLIKLTNDDRRFLPLVRRLNILQRDSVMGKLLLENSMS